MKLIKFKKRLGVVQYMPMKSVKRGLKIWLLYTSEYGYVLRFDLYSGKFDNTGRSGIGLGYEVVMHLTKSMQNKYHHIYFDRLFTSVS